jgi:hypothetical protein
MEMVMVTMHHVKLAHCAHCGDIYLTGSLTGRRSYAEYCSPRCRVAAARARQAAAETSHVDP